MKILRLLGLVALSSFACIGIALTIAFGLGGIERFLSDSLNIQLASREVKTELADDRTTICMLRAARLANKTNPRYYSSTPTLNYYRDCLEEKK